MVILIMIIEYVYYCDAYQSNDWYRIDANLAIISFNELDAKIVKVRTYVVSSFAKAYAIQLDSLNKPCISLESFYFSPIG
jgi:hypothetical protein